MTPVSTGADLLHSTRNDSGRLLSGMIHGPVDGRPVLFVAGAGTGKSMSFGDSELAERGVRIITMDRPGMGGSDIARTRTAESTAADYRTFVSSLVDEKRPRMPVVANSQGALFGLTLALSGTATSLTLVSPADEVAHPRVHALLPAEVTRLPDLARQDPDRARRLLSQFTARDMEGMVLDGSDEQDTAYCSRPEFLLRYRTALAEGFANAGAGYVQDTLLAMLPWSPDLRCMQVPTHVLFGSRDRTHSPDLGATLTERINGAQRQVFDNAGGALLWTHARTVLDVALSAPRTVPQPAT